MPTFPGVWSLGLFSLTFFSTSLNKKKKNFLKPKGQRDFPALRLDAKTAKTNADKAQLFAESVERHFGIQSDNFDSKHFDEVNQFIEDNYVYFYPPEDPDDYRADMDDDHDLVADIDSDTLIRIVKFLNPLSGCVVLCVVLLRFTIIQ